MKNSTPTFYYPYLTSLAFVLLLFMGSCGHVKNSDYEEEDLPPRYPLSVSPITGYTTEQGKEITMSVVLTIEPDQDVLINLESDTIDEATISTNSLTFTTSNWNIPQIVTITGVDDSIYDKDQDYTIIFSPFNSTDRYLQNKLSHPAIVFQNRDDETQLDALAQTGFAVIQSGTSCPAGFGSGKIQFDTEDTNNKDYLFGSVGATVTAAPGIHMNICTATTVGDATIEALKGTNFVVLQNGVCPSGYSAGVIKFDTEDNNNSDRSSGNIGSSYGAAADLGAIFLKVCELNDDPQLESLKHSPFGVLRFGPCPLQSENGYLFFDTEDHRPNTTITGYVGDTKIDSDNVAMYMCMFN